MKPIEISKYEKKQIKTFIKKMHKVPTETITPETIKNLVYGTVNTKSRILSILSWIFLGGSLISEYIHTKDFVIIVWEIALIMSVITNTFIIKKSMNKNNIPVTNQHNPNRLIKQMNLCFKSNMLQPSDFYKTCETLTIYQQYLIKNSGWFSNIFVSKNLYQLITSLNATLALPFINQYFHQLIIPKIIIIILLLISYLIFSMLILYFMIRTPSITTKQKIKDIFYVKKDLMYLKNNLFSYQDNQYFVNNIFINKVKLKASGPKLYRNYLKNKAIQVQKEFMKAHKSHHNHK